ncbi:MAG: glycosyl transferase [Bacteroidia bacterium]|nr:glycosyl transferase [Bacteroidia bacterium]
MKILYGIQCTGNGHITRSIDLVKELKKHAEVDVLTSGSHSEVSLPFAVKFPLKGLSYYFGKHGSFDLLKTAFRNNAVRFLRELRSVPVGEYNMVISDFEPLTAWSAKRKTIYSVSLSNQASLTYKDVPKPSAIRPLSKWFIRSFCGTNQRYGLFYKKYNNSLFYPPIREEVRSLKPSVENYNVVYLPFYGDNRILETLSLFPKEHWVVFSKHTKHAYQQHNVEVLPISNDAFLHALQNCKGVISSAGFGTTSEALYLKKKLLVIPMKNQYEQQCNAYALEQFGVTRLSTLRPTVAESIQTWLDSETVPDVAFENENRKIVHRILTDYISYFETRRTKLPE